jgi:hypothetical protein
MPFRVNDVGKAPRIEQKIQAEPQTKLLSLGF